MKPFELTNEDLARVYTWARDLNDAASKAGLFMPFELHFYTGTDWTGRKAHTEACVGERRWDATVSFYGGKTSELGFFNAMGSCLYWDNVDIEDYNTLLSFMDRATSFVNSFSRS